MIKKVSPSTVIKTNDPRTKVEKRVSYPGYNAFRPFVVEELNRRKTELLSPVVSPFVRMTSCTLDRENGRRYFTLGLHGFDQNDIDMFDSAYGSNAEIVGYSYAVKDGKKVLHTSDMIASEALPPGFDTNMSAKQKESIRNQRDYFKNQQIQSKIFANNSHPIPGITSINVTRQGPFAPFVSKVSWQCYNKAQFEFLRHHFMNVGQYVVVEWGNVFYDNQIKKPLNFSDGGITAELARCVNGGRQYIIDHYVKQNSGNYDFVVGVVSNFDVQLDAYTGIYTCTTTVVSIGELIFGINNQFTYVNVEDDPATCKTSTINDYFQPNGGEFDNLVNIKQHDSSLVSSYHTEWTEESINQNRDSKEIFNNMSMNPNDYRFVSWVFFTDTLLPALFNLINKNKDTVDIQQWFDLSYTSKTNKENWIGYNVRLRSTNPDTMLLVTKDMLNVPSDFTGAGAFGQDMSGAALDGHRGILSKGVWLNVGMIRRAFLGCTNLVNALRQITADMNNATENYWHLSLTWDDEINKWKIVDQKWSDPATVPDIYKFNEIRADGSSYGELLDIQMESSFPPELITQTMLYAKYKSSPASERARLLRKWPHIGNTSNFIFSLNWTNLVDVLSEELQNVPRTVPSSALVTAAGSPQDNTVKARMGGGGDFRTSSKVQTAKTSSKPEPGKKVGQALVSSPFSKQGGFSEAISFTGAKRYTAGVPNLKLPATDLLKGQGSGPGAFLTNSTRLLEPRFRAAYEAWCKAVELNLSQYNIKIVTNYTVRNFTYQENLRKRNAGYKPAEGDTSYHSSGQAADFGITENGTYYSMHNSSKLWIRNQLVAIANEINRETVSKGLPRAELKFLNDPAEAHHIQSGDKRGQTIPDGAYAVNVTYAEFSEMSDSDKQKIVIPNEPQYKDDVVSIENEENRLIAKNLDISTRFGNPIMYMIETQPSAMVAQITRDGLERTTSPNGFVLGFPTTTAITLTLLGLAGISISDVFLCDKLPYVFEQYGAFQTTEITEEISTSGWKTYIRGYFKLIWLEGKK